MTEWSSYEGLTRAEKEEKFEAMKALRDNLPVYEWDEIQGNPYAQKLEFGMLLSEEGKVILKKFQPKGMPRSGDYRGKVRYGKDYVIAYITNFLLKTLDENRKARHFIEKLLTEVLDTYYGALKEIKANEKEQEEREHKKACILAGIDPEKPVSEWNKYDAKAYLKMIHGDVDMSFAEKWLEDFIAESQ